MIHPITGSRSRFLMWWLIWLMTGLGQFLLLFYATPLGADAAVTDGLLSVLIYGLLAIAIWYPVAMLRTDKTNSAMILVNHLAILTITLVGWVFGVKWLTVTIIADPEAYLDFWSSSIYFRLGAGIFIYLVIILAYYLMISMDNISKKNIREASLENMLRETELLMLRSQINPHFLFNSLNSISSLTLTDPPKAREMVIKLSEFMRYALSRKEDKSVPLRRELENIRLYLEIEKVRFGEKLVIEEVIDDNCLDMKIPNMILQPLFENAVKHGVYESIEKVRLKLECSCASGGVSVVITNDYDPDSVPAGGTGTGLRNIRRRLELYYGGRAMLNTGKNNGTFTADLFIPEKKREE